MFKNFDADKIISRSSDQEYYCSGGMNGQRPTEVTTYDIDSMLNLFRGAVVPYLNENQKTLIYASLVVPAEILETFESLKCFKHLPGFSNSAGAARNFWIVVDKPDLSYGLFKAGEYAIYDCHAVLANAETDEIYHKILMRCTSW